MIIIDKTNQQIQELLNERKIVTSFKLDSNHLIQLIKEQKSVSKGIKLYIIECEKQLNGITDDIFLKLKICQLISTIANDLDYNQVVNPPSIIDKNETSKCVINTPAAPIDSDSSSASIVSKVPAINNSIVIKNNLVITKILNIISILNSFNKLLYTYFVRIDNMLYFLSIFAIRLIAFLIIINFFIENIKNFESLEMFKQELAETCYGILNNIKKLLSTVFREKETPQIPIVTEAPKIIISNNNFEIMMLFIGVMGISTLALAFYAFGLFAPLMGIGQLILNSINGLFAPLMGIGQLILNSIFSIGTIIKNKIIISFQAVQNTLGSIFAFIFGGGPPNIPPVAPAIPPLPGFEGGVITMQAQKLILFFSGTAGMYSAYTGHHEFVPGILVNDSNRPELWLFFAHMTEAQILADLRELIFSIENAQLIHTNYGRINVPSNVEIATEFVELPQVQEPAIEEPEVEEPPEENDAGRFIRRTTLLAAGTAAGILFPGILENISR